MLIAAFSGRALAAAARRAGYAPLVADLFADEDTAGLAPASVRVEGSPAGGFDADGLLDGLDALARRHAAPVGLVYGAGFEARPALLAEIGRRWPVLGNAPDVLARLKDPDLFAAACARLGIPHPEISRKPPERPAGWLSKYAGGAGGAHVAPADAVRSGDDGVYFQRRVEGRAVSALFVAAQSELRILGFSDQWRAPSTAEPFRFGGAVRPADLPPRTQKAMGEAVRAISSTFGLRGLNSADFILGETGWWLLEINPRPGATLDIFDDPAAPLFALHLAAVMNEPLPPAPELSGAAATRIVYAPRPIMVPADIRYPEWTADRPPPGTRLGANDPFCTVLARNQTACEAMTQCAQYTRYWLSVVDGHEQWTRAS